MYATQADMVRIFGEDEVIALTDRDHTGMIDAAVLDGALHDAAAEINSYLAAMFRVPLQPVPSHLVRLCCNIARYYLTGSSTLETDPIRDRYKAAVHFLTLVAAGKVTLGPTENGITPSADNTVQFIQGTRVFSRQGPGAF